MEALICTEQTHKFDDTIGPFPCGTEATHMCWTISGQWEPHCDRHAEGYVQNNRAMALTPVPHRLTTRPFRDLVREREQRDPGSAARVQREYERQVQALQGEPMTPKCQTLVDDEHRCYKDATVRVRENAHVGWGGVHCPEHAMDVLSSHWHHAEGGRGILIEPAVPVSAGR